MRFVILRDDDTNALTPVECLERLYRPFLGRGLPVNLAIIPDVRTDAVRPDGRTEQFLFAKNGCRELTLPIGDNEEMVRYLRANPGYQVVQHGYDHSLFEFDSENAGDIRDRLEQGTQLLLAAGFSRPLAFVAPHDKFSRLSLGEAAKRFPVISTGWFELGRLPVSWWPQYALKKITRTPHWRSGQTLLLSHPGCLLSCHRPCQTILNEIKKAVASRVLTVLVTHWWEYFYEGKPNELFIQVLHDTARWLAEQPDLKVISFGELLNTNLPLV
ncbi:MAG TPA: DUF2334 domain-containing protein [Candidatus Acidoferrum sp.]|jgi:hypothetical protein|nr:DUF2334 domain-containing protein [Candidatus Acidoferrum sp.]